VSEYLFLSSREVSKISTYNLLHFHFTTSKQGMGFCTLRGNANNFNVYIGQKMPMGLFLETAWRRKKNPSLSGHSFTKNQTF